MWSKNRLTKILNVRYPMIQAGMAGGMTTPALVAAVSEAGGLGTLGAGYMPPDHIRAAIHEIRQLTDRPFAVNLFVPAPFHVDDTRMAQMNERLDHIRAALHIDHPAEVTTEGPPFEEQLAVIIEEQVPVFSSTFGVPPKAVVEILKERGVIVIGTATTVREAVELEENDVDVIVGQGSEAGGHRGTFDGAYETAMVGTMALIPQLVDHVRVPVVASGGIMDGRGAAASLVLGADGVQMGTAFLTCAESGTPSAHQEAILHSTDESTVVTRAFSGKPARGIHNRFIAEMDPYTETYPDYPIPNSLTKDIRTAAKEQHAPDYMALWAGQASALSREQSAADLIHSVVDEVEESSKVFVEEKQHENSGI